jgi:DNA-binding transcriptional LysR family regulator
LQKIRYELKLNWDDLRIFLSVARERSLSGAARSLRLDPAPVGRRVARLEEDLDTVLFAKSPQGYVATSAGERLIARAEAAEDAISGAVGEARGHEEGLTGTIRVGAPDGCATYLLPQVTQAIQAANPGLSVQIVALPRVFNLSKREADMAIAVSRPRTGRVRVQKISDYRLCLAASQDYLASEGAVEERRQLKERRIIGYIPDMIFDRELDYLAEIGLENVDLASNLVSVQLGWLKAGAGIGMVHEFVLPDVPQLTPVLRDEVQLTRAFWLVRHADDARIERLNRFAKALTEGLRAEISRRSAT